VDGRDAQRGERTSETPKQRLLRVRARPRTGDDQDDPFRVRTRRDALGEPRQQDRRLARPRSSRHEQGTGRMRQDTLLLRVGSGD
jgi:hypothetical protein